jgi:hypothetical protein
MQALISGRKVEDDSRKDAILEVMSDKYCRAILEISMEKPKSAMEISADTRIPISTVYRRLQTLHDNKLLGISGSISDDGKKYFLYKSKVKAIATSFNGSNVEIEIVPNINFKSKNRSCICGKTIFYSCDYNKSRFICF